MVGASFPNAIAGFRAVPFRNTGSGSLAPEFTGADFVATTVDVDATCFPDTGTRALADGFTRMSVVVTVGVIATILVFCGIRDLVLMFESELVIVACSPAMWRFLQQWWCLFASSTKHTFAALQPLNVLNASDAMLDSPDSTSAGERTLALSSTSSKRGLDEQTFVMLENRTLRTHRLPGEPNRFCSEMATKKRRTDPVMLFSALCQPKDENGKKRKNVNGKLSESQQKFKLNSIITFHVLAI